MKQAINIRLDKQLLTELDHYATELDRTRTSLIEKSISAYFDQLDEMLADKRIDQLQSGKTQAVPLEDVFRKAGIRV
jgi:predicted transcriptional regulator